MGTDAFKTAVILHFAQECAAQGLTVLVTVDEDEITVLAFPAEASASALDIVMPMLRSGRLDEAFALPAEPHALDASECGRAFQPRDRSRRA